MLQAFKSLFLPDTVKQQTHSAYFSIITQSRQPIFYTDWHVPDTLDGRFDIIVLHMFLVLTVCEKDLEFCRALTELFFADMDRSLREMGVGDTGVGKRVKAMAQAFYGRIKAYHQTIDDESGLKETLRRNVWREKAVEDASIRALADYMRRNYLLSCEARSDCAGSFVLFIDPVLLLRSPQD